MRNLGLYTVVMLAGTLMATAVPSAADLGVGTRALGMGGAYTAIADDTSAPYWNPAGLANAKRFSLQLPNVQVRIDSKLNWRDVVDHPPTDDSERIELLRKLGDGVTEVAISANMAIVTSGFAVSVIPSGVARLDGSGMTFSGPGGLPAAGDNATISGIGYVSIGVSAARPLKDGGTIGVTLKSVRSTTYSETITYTGVGENYDKVEQPEVNESGLGLDVGYLKEMTPSTTVGVMIRNLVCPGLGKSSPDRQVNVGVAHKLPKGDVLLAADISSLFDHPNINLGAEVGIGKFVDLWVGIYNRKATLGAGLGILGGKLQAAYSPENLSMFSASLSF